MLTHTQLCITADEHAGLIQVRDHLRRQAPVHVRDEVTAYHSRSRQVTTEGRLGFNMEVAAGRPDDPEGWDCGSVACIGGHLSLILQGYRLTDTSFPVDALKAAAKWTLSFMPQGPGEEQKTLYRLFFPDAGPGYHNITPAQAADAIDDLLTRGNPNWHNLEEY